MHVGADDFDAKERGRELMTRICGAAGPCSLGQLHSYKCWP